MNSLLRRKFLDRLPAYGLWVTTASTAVVEIAAALELDWICIDLEHGSLTLKDVSDLLVATRGSSLSAFVRPPHRESEAITRVLDLGAHGLMLPAIESATELLRIRRKTAYPPAGVRGIGGERSASWGFNLEEYVRTANAELMLVPMIETAAGFEAFDEIANTIDIEAFFLGPLDMAASYGYGTDTTQIHDKVTALKERAQQRGIVAGIGVGGAEEALRRVEEGFGMISLGTDLRLMVNQVKHLQRSLSDFTPRISGIRSEHSTSGGEFGNPPVGADVGH